MLRFFAYSWGERTVRAVCETRRGGSELEGRGGGGCNCAAGDPRTTCSRTRSVSINALLCRGRRRQAN